MTDQTPKTFTFADGRTVNRLGFGTMRLTGQPGNFGPYEDWKAGIKTLQAAREAGVDFFDTAKAYGPRYSEQIVADALAPYGDTFIATKGGITKTGVGGANINRDGRPEQLRAEIEESLADLKTEQIDLYYLHAPDRNVPFAEQIGALVDAKARGEIARIGVSNVSLDQLQEAMALTHIDAVQNRFDPVNKGDMAVLDHTTQHGIAFVPWGPLGADPTKPGSPLADGKTDIEAIEGATPIQAALIQLLRRAPNILPIPGTRSAQHAVENARALSLVG